MLERHHAPRCTIGPRRGGQRFPKDRWGFFEAFARHGFGIEISAVKRIDHLGRGSNRHRILSTETALAAPRPFLEHVVLTIKCKPVFQGLWYHHALMTKEVIMWRTYVGLILLVGLSLGSHGHAEIHWGPLLPMPDLPKGWHGDCVLRPVAQAQCAIWRDHPAHVRLLITHYADGRRRLDWTLPEQPSHVQLVMGLDMPYPVRQVLPTTLEGGSASNTEVAFQYLARLQLNLDYLTPPQTVLFSLDGLTPALQRLAAATAHVRHRLALQR
jgi:hypothetical protein